MVSLTLIVVGFVVAMALVIVLARTSTARWEKTGRAARAPRREVIAPGAALAGDAAPQPATAVRRAVAAMRDPASLRGSLTVVAGILVTAASQVASRVHPTPRRTTGRAPAVSVDDEATDGAAPPSPNRTRGSRTVRRHGVPGATGHRLFHPGPRPSRRRAHGLHRLDRTEESPPPRADDDESLTGG